MAIRPENIREMAAAYSIGALDLEEKEIFERLLQENHPIAVRSYQEMAQIASILPFSADLATPPANIKAQLLARIKTEQDVQPATGSKSQSVSFPESLEALQGEFSSKINQWKRIAIGLAAACLMIAAGAGWYINHLQQDIQLAVFQNSVALEQIKQLTSTLERKRLELQRVRHPNTKVYLAAPTPDAPDDISGKLFYSADARAAVFYGFNMTTQADKDYQLWMIREGVPVAAGLLVADEAGIYSASVDQISIDGLSAFAVSWEEKGGSTTRNSEGNLVPSGPVYLVSAITGG